MNHNDLPEELISIIEEEPVLIMVENISNRETSYIITGSSVYLLAEIEEDTIQFTYLFDLASLELPDLNLANIINIQLFNITEV